MEIDDQKSEDSLNDAAKATGTADDKSSGDDRSNGITLSVEQYNALMDRLDELEDAELGTAVKRESAGDDVDALAQEGLRRARTTEKEVDLDKLPPQEQFNLVIETIGERYIQPLLIKMQEMTIRQEIKDLEASEEGKDFKSFEKEVYLIGRKNPTLSVREAFLLAKEKAGGKGAKDESDPLKRKELLRTLPARRFPMGEKPGQSSSISKEDRGSTRVDAATAALEAMEREGKIKF